MQPCNPLNIHLCFLSVWFQIIPFKSNIDTRAVVREHTEIPWTLYLVSSNGNILQNYNKLSHVAVRQPGPLPSLSCCPSSLATADLFCISVAVSWQEQLYEWNPTVCDLMGSAFPVSMILWRFIQVVVFTSSRFLFIPEQYFIVWMHHVWLTIYSLKNI